MTGRCQSFRCPRLDKGYSTCKYGCTTAWTMCHDFQENRCDEKDLHEACRCCSKGWHVRPNDRRASNYDDWESTSSARGPLRKKRRRGIDTEARRRQFKLELRLRLLGFYNSEIPLTAELEKAYIVYKNTVEDSAIAEEDKKRKKLKLRKAFTTIMKVIQGRDTSPISTDSEDGSLGRESDTETASSTDSDDESYESEDSE